MQTRIHRDIVAGYILNPDYCEIKLPDGTSFAFTRVHPVRQANGRYQVESEWCEQFISRMRGIIEDRGFPLMEKVALTQLHPNNPDAPGCVPLKPDWHDNGLGPAPVYPPAEAVPEKTEVDVYCSACGQFSGTREMVSEEYWGEICSRDNCVIYAGTPIGKAIQRLESNGMDRESINELLCI